MVKYFALAGTAPTESHPLSLHDALPIWPVPLREVLIRRRVRELRGDGNAELGEPRDVLGGKTLRSSRTRLRSEEHTSELQSRPHLVCRLLLEKKNHTNPSGNRLMNSRGS